MRIGEVSEAMDGPIQSDHHEAVLADGCTLTRATLLREGPMTLSLKTHKRYNDIPIARLLNRIKITGLTISDSPRHCVTSASVPQIVHSTISRHYGGYSFNMYFACRV